MPKTAIISEHASPLAAAPSVSATAASMAPAAVPYRPAVFLDKDGTLLVDVPYNVDPVRMRLAPGAADGLGRLGRLDVPLIVVSNQPGVALGLFAEAALDAVRMRLAALFAECGAALSGFYYCPHHPDGEALSYGVDCACRKPADGLLRAAAVDFGVALENSWMIGDILHDVEAGRRAGCRTILIDCGNETQWRPGPGRTPHYTVGDMGAAADIVCAALLPAARGGAA